MSVILQELILREDGSVCGVGNFIEVTELQARLLVKDRVAKFPSLPVGQVPDDFQDFTETLSHDENEILEAQEQETEDDG